ncbi:MAG: hypothetical protein H8E14_16710 [Candidatus Marinimicrobia bacterium]|nr:hypothetical protein [Candidatus Neomarinimicrobiota bacterium]
MPLSEEALALLDLEILAVIKYVNDRGGTHATVVTVWLCVVRDLKPQLFQPADMFININLHSI